MEFSLIDRIRERTEQGREDVRLGIGDDAALLAVPPGQELAVAIDTLVEGVHFPLGTAPADIGWKALAVNLSDLAAMGAVPAWALLALTLPQADAAFIDGLADGFAQLARQHRLALVGGDTTRGPLTLSVAVHGFVPPEQALTRAGARVGDAVLVTGTLGDAAAGLHCLQTAMQVDSRTAMRDALVERLNRPVPRLAAGLALRGRASACLDVSDGLLADLGHLCAASGVGAEIDAALLPCSSALLGLFDDGAARDFALSGGDDYELCFTVPAARVGEVQADLARLGGGATRIGRIVAGEGVRVRDAGGDWLEPERAGWDHFAA
ncbi:MAG: thiamine-phosphate kinase [Rhodanobacter sp. 68-29]|uniref:thiamine-phosphate kinase n=1 Tax=Rhodanobacter sp. PCA2 TaxID=2006117 RepID=UPI00086BE32C|nr:thiamine-phosphate kinase [Rhodanobacter sp. PCA2]MBA2077595.1 thiamine-phosphate kinase [Rhodanobacter sp. PCA2]MBN8922549.1 thiamine-phosphate kinase [Rhodanobacter sp.]ODU76143.1 MAG: thiamine-phosphate kinase [Rhodanobacter sp. SCN 69-32]OJY62358.1 MAG: thiamine-phosphate kinase [Rhodanobacter sp. 68-29]